MAGSLLRGRRRDGIACPEADQRVSVVVVACSSTESALKIGMRSHPGDSTVIRVGSMRVSFRETDACHAPPHNRPPSSRDCHASIHRPAFPAAANPLASKGIDRPEIWTERHGAAGAGGRVSGTVIASVSASLTALLTTGTMHGSPATAVGTSSDLSCSDESDRAACDEPAIHRHATAT